MGIAEPILHPLSGEAADTFCPQHGKFLRPRVPGRCAWLCQPVPGVLSVPPGDQGLFQCQHSLLSLSLSRLSQMDGIVN